MLVIQITHHIKPEHVEHYIEATLKNAHETKKEPGNIRFDLLKDPSNPCVFQLYEVYVDRDAQQSHLASAHFASWKEAVKGVFERVSIQKFEAVHVPELH